MATTTIPWGDGSGDNIYLTYSASQGDQTVLVSSDANGGAARQKVITFVSTVGNISRSLTVLQESGMDYVSITWNDVCITYNDTAIAYPYAEEYIVFVDSVVEQICATNWGDGTGIKPSQAAQVTNSQFGTTFRNNTDITSFNEFQYFTGITYISQAAFYGCTSLEEITFPNTVAGMGNQVFVNAGLTSFTFPESLQNYATEIRQLFNNCKSLVSVYGLENIKLGSYCFSGADVMSEVHVSSLEGFCKNSFTAESGTPFYSSSAGTRGLYVNNTLVTDIVIPNTITSLNAYLFRNNNTITSVIIHSSVTSIGVSALQFCTSLTYVEIGSACDTIDAAAFYFVGTTTNKCTYVLRPVTPPTLANTNAFTANRINKIYVPSGTLSAYQSASNWSSFASYMAELDANGNIPT